MLRCANIIPWTIWSCSRFWAGPSGLTSLRCLQAGAAVFTLYLSQLHHPPLISLGLPYAARLHPKQAQRPCHPFLTLLSGEGEFLEHSQNSSQRASWFRIKLSQKPESWMADQTPNQHRYAPYFFSFLTVYKVNVLWRSGHKTSIFTALWMSCLHSPPVHQSMWVGDHWRLSCQSPRFLWAQEAQTLYKLGGCHLSPLFVGGFR